MNNIKEIMDRICKGKGQFSEIVNIGADVFLGIVRATTFSMPVVEARQEMLKYADSGRKGILVGSKCPLTQGKVPPWVWGTYCKVDMISEGEEE